MKALVFRHNLAREAVSAVGGRVDRHAFVSRLAPVRLEDVEELPLPADDWVRVETTISGLCGSDVKQILLNGSRDNPLTALVSFPHVLGHEVVGRRVDTGQRVVLNPWLSCTPRGIDPPCAACQAGRYPWCRNFRSGDLPVSIHIGNCAAAAGAHAERFGAHVSQLFGIPDGVTDEAAVLADPVSVSLRSILLAPPVVGQAVLVYGSGTLAFAVIALLRHLYPGTAGVGGDAAGRAGRAGDPPRRARRAFLLPRRARRAGRTARRRDARSRRGASTTGCRTVRRSSTTRSARSRPSRPHSGCSRPAAPSSSPASSRPSASSGPRSTSRSCASSARTASASKRWAAWPSMPWSTTSTSSRTDST